MYVQDTYEGDFQFGKRHGQGSFVYSSPEQEQGQGRGDCYVGQWRADARHGAGVFTYGASGKVLKGFWEDNVWQGKGAGQYCESCAVMCCGMLCYTVLYKLCCVLCCVVLLLC